VSRNRTDHAKRYHRDSQGRFCKAPVLNAEQLAVAESWILRLEDPAANCLTVPYGLPVLRHFWGHTRPTKES